jgi:hypothetical protein
MISIPKFNINMQWVIPVATAIWAVWTWAADRKRDREDERTRIAALYVNPLVSACEDLQSRIYSILEHGGLRTLRKRYPDGSYAEETLYLIVRYFGWMVAVERHGPYTQDPAVMRLMSSISGVFAAASSAQQVGPFNFFHPEQKDLGKLVMTTIVESDNLEPDTISCHEFKKRLASPPWSDSASVQETLEALRSADDGVDLPGRDRLAEAQNHLVDLVGYIEGKEGYTLYQGERKKCRTPAQLRAVAGNTASPAVSA